MKINWNTYRIETKYLFFKSIKRLLVFLFFIISYLLWVFYLFFKGAPTSFEYPKFMILAGFLNERFLFSGWSLVLPLFSLLLGVDVFSKRKGLPSNEYLFLLPYSRIRAVLIRFSVGVAQIAILMLPFLLISLFEIVALKSFDRLSLILRFSAIFVTLLTFFSFTFFSSLLFESWITSSLVGIFLWILSIYSVQNSEDTFFEIYSPLYVLLNQDYLFTKLFPSNQIILWLLISIFAMVLSYGYLKIKDI